MQDLDPDLTIEMLGGTSAAAEFFNIQPPSVCGWRKDGVPPARAQTIKYARPDIYEAALRAAQEKEAAHV